MATKQSGTYKRREGEDRRNDRNSSAAGMLSSSKYTFSLVYLTIAIFEIIHLAKMAALTSHGHSIYLFSYYIEDEYDDARCILPTLCTKRS
jgi:hypothetical protein